MLVYQIFTSVQSALSLGNNPAVDYSMFYVLHLFLKGLVQYCNASRVYPLERFLLGSESVFNEV